MIKISNRQYSEQEFLKASQQTQFIDRIVEVPGPTIYIQNEATSLPEQVSSPETIVKYIDRIVEVPVEANLEPLKKDLNEVKAVILNHVNNHKQAHQAVQTILDMQSRALVALKEQRDIDRSRRLMLIKRVKKEQDQRKKLEFKFKLAIGASFIISLLALCAVIGGK